VKVFTLSLKVANEVKPDVIYGLKVAYALPSYIVARKLNAVAIFAEFGTWMYRDFISSNFLRRIIRLPFFIGSIIAFNLPFDLFIMTNDRTNGDKVFKYFKIPENKCLFLLNGVDKNPIQRTKENITYLRKKYKLPLDRKIILSVGRLVSWKRVDKVIKFFSSIKGYKYNLQLVIVGNGDQEVKLKEIVKEEELGDSIKFMGDLPHKDIFEIMALSDVYISFYDLSNLSNTMLEAISSGLPIISLNDGSLSEVVTDGYNGILINSFDEKDRVIEMLFNDEILERMSKASYEIALKKLYTWDERMEKELRIVENLIEAKRKDYGR
jgi:glycosyltransferase involved in cell wall biosynthesis